MKNFEWAPGVGINREALARLRAHFRRPATPMGEAWFMGEERRMFNELAGDISRLTAWQLQEPLQEIASGTSSFGPQDEWHDWYHHLLGELVPRSHEHFVSSLLESLITCFFALYPNGIYRAPYPEFRDDVLNTLGRCVMEPDCWDGTDIVVGRMLHRSNNNPNKVWCWWDASGDFSASLYLCIKTLPESLVQRWFRSVIAIPSPHWRAQVIVWLVGSHDLLSGKLLWPSELRIEAHPSVDWEWSHCLKPELASSDESGALPAEALLPRASREAVLATARQYFTEDVYLGWLESISRVPYLEAELAAIPSTFEAMYVGRGAA